MKIIKPPLDTQWNMYANENNGMRYVFEHEAQVEMATSDLVIKVIARVAEFDDQSTHWAWMTNGKLGIVQLELFMLNMCFPYDPELLEKNGVGLRIPIVITPNTW